MSTNNEKMKADIAAAQAAAAAAAGDDAPPEKPEYFVDSYSKAKEKTKLEQKQEFIDKNVCVRVR